MNQVINNNVICHVMSWIARVSVGILFINSCYMIQPEKGSRHEEMLLGLALLPRSSEFNWNLPPGFPVPVVPSDNPMTQEKVELGRHLFFEKRLSRDSTMSCGSCHLQELAFSDGKALPRGIATQAHPMGEEHPRNSQQLVNVAYLARLTWSNPIFRTLEQQSRVPLFGEIPVELGLKNDSFLELLRSDPLYQGLFTRAFSEQNPFIEQNVRFALASFQRILISGNSKFDRAMNGDRGAISPSAARGASFFNSEIAECFHCHGGFNFTNTIFHGAQAAEEFGYHNNGTHTKAYYDSLPLIKQGLMEVTNDPRDQGKFKAPTLRNVAVTFPYMHDGSIMCDNIFNPSHPDGRSNGASLLTCAKNALGKVVDQYSRGGNSPVHPNVDQTFIRPFPMSAQERTDLIEFLLSLTDDRFLSDPRFSDPFKK